MKRLLLSCILLLTVIVSSSGSFGADWRKGKGAFNRGDYAEAFKWYRLAAEKGNTTAQFNLGFMYENGRGVPQDYAEAVKWYRLAAHQGNENAMVALESLEFHLAPLSSEKPSSPSVICRGALGPGFPLRWDAGTFSKPFVTKAIAMGLSLEICAEITGRENEKVSIERLTSYEVCKSATTYTYNYNSERWRTGPTAEAYRQEAIQRGLSLKDCLALIDASLEQFAKAAEERTSRAIEETKRAEAAEKAAAKAAARKAKVEGEKAKTAISDNKRTKPSESEIARLKLDEELRKAKEELRKAKKEAKKAQRAEAELRKELAARRQPLGTEKDQGLEGIENIDFGRYHALVIGINNYKYLPKLKTAAKDARAVAKLLKDDYGFTVKQLIDPSRNDILDALDNYREALGPNDNLLIYYAGHGVLDEEVDRGYWQTVEAKQHRRSGWVSNATITDTMKGLSAKHVMVVADSCFSGSLVRGSRTKSPKRGDDYWQRMAKKWARVVITSGGLEPVSDKGGSGHSPFAKAFMDVLRDNASVMDGTQLFSRMRRPVMLAANQTPEYGDVRLAGHDGGDFIFVRKK